MQMKAFLFVCFISTTALYSSMLTCLNFSTYYLLSVLASSWMSRAVKNSQCQHVRLTAVRTHCDNRQWIFFSHMSEIRGCQLAMTLMCFASKPSIPVTVGINNSDSWHEYYNNENKSYYTHCWKLLNQRCDLIVKNTGTHWNWKPLTDQATVTQTELNYVTNH